MKRIRLGVVILGIAALITVPVNRALAQRKPFQPPQQRPGAAQAVDYEFTVLQTAKVRLLNVPVEFDDKGKPKKLTPAELKARKGDDPAEQKLAGIKSDFNVLKPGDVVQVSFSRPRDPKNLEKTTWSALAGSMVGIVTSVDGDNESKSLTVRVSPNGSPQGEEGGKQKMMMLRSNAPKNVIKPEQRQGSVIVIVEQAPDQEQKPGKRREKN